MSQSNDDNNDTDSKKVTDNTITNHHAHLAAIDINAKDSIDDDVLDTFYHHDALLPIMIATLDYINERVNDGLTLPYFVNIDPERWQAKFKALDIYITDAIEGRALNLDARDKDYATNILSYPSDLPSAIIELMPVLPLGELVICHEVVAAEAKKQNKTVTQHISHLFIHGVLHLLGFDHELGQAETDEMEGFEIEILASLDLPNPYI